MRKWPMYLSNAYDLVKRLLYYVNIDTRDKVFVSLILATESLSRFWLPFCKHQETYSEGGQTWWQFYFSLRHKDLHLPWIYSLSVPYCTIVSQSQNYNSGLISDQTKEQIVNLIIKSVWCSWWLLVIFEPKYGKFQKLRIHVLTLNHSQ